MIFSICHCVRRAARRGNRTLTSIAVGNENAHMFTEFTKVIVSLELLFIDMPFQRPKSGMRVSTSKNKYRNSYVCIGRDFLLVWSNSSKEEKEIRCLFQVVYTLT